MESLLSGPYASLMVVAAFGLFAWLFFDLMEEMRDGGGDRGRFRPSWRFLWPRRAARKSARFATIRARLRPATARRARIAAILANPGDVDRSRNRGDER